MNNNMNIGGQEYIGERIITFDEKIPEWLRPRKGIPRMFENEIFERLSHVHPLTPHIIYLPVIAYMLYKASKIFQLYQIVPLFLFGTFIWTLMEYTLHRFIFHFTPKSEIGKKYIL